MNRWFLPETPDVLGLLQRQVEVTQSALRSFVQWTGGDTSRGDVIRQLEHEADAEARTLRRALRSAFSTPIDAEDLYALSTSLDAVLNAAKNIVGEAEVMATAPDGPCGEMADHLRAAVDHVAAAIRELDGDGEVATRAADDAIHAARKVERVYRRAMSALLDVADLREVMGRRELYRRFARAADDVVDVAERVWYAVVKES